MRINVFIERVIELGYEPVVTQSSIFIFRLYGEDLREKTQIATILLAAPYHFTMSLDTTSANDGIGELISEFGMTSLKNRGRLEKFSIYDGNYYNTTSKY